MDLTLRDGSDLKSAIQTAKEIDQQSKLSGFNQEALDQMEGYGNSQFEANAEEGVDLLKEFYMNDVVESERTQLESEALAKPKFTQGGISCRIFSKSYKGV